MVIKANDDGWLHVTAFNFTGAITHVEITRISLAVCLTLADSYSPVLAHLQIYSAPSTPLGATFSNHYTRALAPRTQEYGLLSKGESRP